jgi:hypothetical protein
MDGPSLQAFLNGLRRRWRAREASVVPQLRLTQEDGLEWTGLNWMRRILNVPSMSCLNRPPLIPSPGSPPSDIDSALCVLRGWLRLDGGTAESPPSVQRPPWPLVLEADHLTSISGRETLKEHSAFRLTSPDS